VVGVDGEAADIRAEVKLDNEGLLGHGHLIGSSLCARKCMCSRLATARADGTSGRKIVNTSDPSREPGEA
jgi:hypothetical protein